MITRCLCALTIVLLLAACGGGGDGSGGGGNPVFDGGSPPPPSDGDGDGGGDTSPPSHRDDHGNTRGNPTIIGVGTNFSGTLTAGDVDYFRVFVNRPGTLVAHTTGSTDTVGRLENSNGTQLATNDDGGADHNFRIERSVSSGTYYIRVTGYSGDTTGHYTLYVRLGGDDHGDTRQTATTVVSGSNPTGELTAGDVDYFRITVDRPGRLNLLTHGTTDTLGHLEDSGGTVLTRDDNGGSHLNFRIEHDISPGTYYIRVAGHATRAVGSYSLRVGFVPGNPDSSDDQGGLVGGSGDVRVNLTWHADIDLDLFVTNPCVQTLGYREGRTNTCDGFMGEWDRDDEGIGFGSDNPNAENIVWTNGAPRGRYIVRVTYYDGDVPADYTVRVFYGSRQRTYTGRLDPANDFRVRRHVANFDFTGSSASQADEASRFQAGSQALSQAARSLGVTAVEAMSSRGKAPDGSSLTIAGQPVSFGNGADSSKSPRKDLSFTGAEPDWTEAERPERSGSWSEFMHGSRFDVAVGEEMRVWGEAHGIKGNNESRFLGFERHFGHGLSAGVAFSDTANEGKFGLAESESLQASLESAYQYLHFSAGASTELWSLVGTGQGELSLIDDIGTVETDLSMQMLAFGSSHGLAPLIAGFAPTVSADGFLVRLESEGRAALRALAGEARRVRAGVLFERPPEGHGWTPKIGFGVRHEDDERGVAMRTEVMAGIGYVRGRLRVEGMTYLWPTGSGKADPGRGGLRENGLGARLTADYRAAPDGRGLAVSVDALAGSVPDAPVWKTDKVADRSTSAHLQVGYGFASGLGRWMPYGEIHLDGDEQRFREGVRHTIGGVSLDFFGEHQLGVESEHGIHFGITGRF